MSSILIGEVGEVLALARGEVVEDPDVVAAREQRARQRRADETRAAGDEIERHGVSGPPGVVRG